MRRALSAVLFLALVASRADALTVRDVIELSRAGLSEDVLLALIEVDPSVFAIDTATMKTLKEAGVSQKVMIAMIRSGRTPPSPEPVVPPLPASEPQPPVIVPPPQVIVIDHHDSPPAREVAVPVPVYVPVYVRQHGFSPTTPARNRTSRSERFIPATGLGAPPPLPTTELLVRHVTVAGPRPDLKAPEPEPRPKPDPRDR